MLAHNRPASLRKTDDAQIPSFQRPGCRLQTANVHRHHRRNQQQQQQQQRIPSMPLKQHFSRVQLFHLAMEVQEIAQGQGSSSLCVDACRSTYAPARGLPPRSPAASLYARGCLAPYAARFGEGENWRRYWCFNACRSCARRRSASPSTELASAQQPGVRACVCVCVTERERKGEREGGSSGGPRSQLDEAPLHVYTHARMQLSPLHLHAPSPLSSTTHSTTRSPPPT
jgi:hypothetical protein